MLEKLISKLTLFALRNKRLTGDQRTAIMAEALKNISLFPYKEVIKFDASGSLIVRGKKLDMEQTVLLRDSCIALQDNFARRLFEEQISYEALKIGVHSGLNPEMIQFSKAILWWNNEQNKLIASFAGE